MQGGAPAICPKCSNFVLPEWLVCPWCGLTLRFAPTAPGFASPRRFLVTPDPRQIRGWRRTRRGLILAAIGLLISWIPFVAAVAALFLSLGSTFLFLGARSVSRRHEVAVVAAFLLLSTGGVILGILVGSFLLQFYDAARTGLPLRDLRDPASLLIWATLPATGLVTAGFALQVLFLLPPRHRSNLALVSLFLFLAAIAATFLADPELAMLDARATRGVLIADFLLRISLYRLLEAPAYVGLAILYLTAYWDALAYLAPRRAAAPVT